MQLFSLAAALPIQRLSAVADGPRTFAGVGEHGVPTRFQGAARLRAVPEVTASISFCSSCRFPRTPPRRKRRHDDEISPASGRRCHRSDGRAQPRAPRQAPDPYVVAGGRDLLRSGPGQSESSPEALGTRSSASGGQQDRVSASGHEIGCE